MSRRFVPTPASKPSASPHQRMRSGYRQPRPLSRLERPRELRFTKRAKPRTSPLWRWRGASEEQCRPSAEQRELVSGLRTLEHVTRTFHPLLVPHSCPCSGGITGLLFPMSPGVTPGLGGPPGWKPCETGVPVAAQYSRAIAPALKPAPKVTMRTLSPRLILPLRTFSSRAIGSSAEIVFPYR